MSLPGLLPGTDFKKNYNFYWQLNGFSKLGNIFTTTGLQGDYFSEVATEALIAFKAFCVLNILYVSQLTQKIDLPDDEFEIENIEVGLVDFPVVKKVKMDDIKVTYLEDTGNTVYNFHKMWMNCVTDKQHGFSFRAMEPFAMEGWYIPLDKSESELKAIANVSSGGVVDAITNPASIVSNAIGSSGAHIYNPISDPGISPLAVRGLQIYPQIFPIKISRGQMNKGGKELATIDITYKRIPKLIGMKPACYRWKSDSSYEARTSGADLEIALVPTIS